MTPITAPRCPRGQGRLLEQGDHAGLAHRCEGGACLLTQTWSRLLLLASAVGAVLLIPSAVAFSAFAPGYTGTTFATGFANNGDVGPVGLAFDIAHNLYVMDYATGLLYKFGPGGGAADSNTQVT